MKTLQQIEALTEAVAILDRARGKCAGDNYWAYRRLDRAVEYVSKQQSALCNFHFLENPTVGDFRKVEDAVRGA